jgi:membrane protease subunit HflK
MAAAARGAAAAAEVEEPGSLGTRAEPAAQQWRRPPDLDELIRRSQDRLKTIMPGGLNGGVVIIGLLLLRHSGLTQAVYTVQPDERGVETLFGKFRRTEVSDAGPAFHAVAARECRDRQCHRAAAEDRHRDRRAAVRKFGLMLTGDQNIVNVEFSVLFSVTDPRSPISIMSPSPAGR